MIRKLFSIFIIVFFVGLTKIYSQQNLFNIPSGDITEKNKAFYQHQINLYRTNLESKGHFVYGLGKGWDVGLNLVGKGIYFAPDWRVAYNSDPAQGALYPYLMLTAQKQFHISKNLDFNVGVQGGYNISRRISNKEFAFFNYAIGILHFMEHKSRVVLGTYHTNRMFVGEGNKVGILVGYEIKITKRFYLMGDWVSGNNDSGAGVLGGMYNVGKRTQLCAGLLVPNPDNPKPLGIVLEINLLGWDLDID